MDSGERFAPLNVMGIMRQCPDRAGERGATNRFAPWTPVVERHLPLAVAPVGYHSSFFPLVAAEGILAGAV
jgi:hypothetical protein